MYQNKPEEIHILLSADIAAKLYTDNIKYFPDLGLAAFETKLGWTIMGKTESNKIKSEDSLSILSLSLLASNANLSDLWRLYTLGIANEDNKETHRSTF